MENKEIVVVLQKAQEVNLSTQSVVATLTEVNRQLQVVIDSLQPKAAAFDEYYSKSGYLSMKAVSDRIPVLPNGMTNSNQKILKMLIAVGDIQNGYYGYETLAQGRNRGLVTRETFDSIGRKHTSVLATQAGFLYIGRALKRFYGTKETIGETKCKQQNLLLEMN